MKKMSSFFEKYFVDEEFIDRKEINNEEGIDVIIPLMNTNPLFKKNLYSYYKEIPINRLIIGDGGITDDSLEILSNFPRIEIVDQKKYNSLGYCIAELISKVKTEWFVYLHADVSLPHNWFDKMRKYQNKYDWYECDRRYLAIIEHKLPNSKKTKRPGSGSQMGRTKAFRNIIKRIDDDYLYRNEDLIFAELIETEGFKYGYVHDTYHFHQQMNKKGEKEPRFKHVYVQREPNKEWEIKVCTMQIRGLVKYVNPKPYLIDNANKSIKVLLNHNALDIKRFKLWVKKTNKVWLKYLKFGEPFIEKILNYIIL